MARVFIFWTRLPLLLYLALPVHGQAQTPPSPLSSTPTSPASASPTQVASPSNLAPTTPVCVQPRATEVYTPEKVSSALTPEVSKACDISVQSVNIIDQLSVISYQAGQVFFNTSHNKNIRLLHPVPPEDCPNIFSQILQTCVPAPLDCWGGWMVIGGANHSITVYPENPLPQVILPVPFGSPSQPSSQKLSVSLPSTSQVPSGVPPMAGSSLRSGASWNSFTSIQSPSNSPSASSSVPGSSPNSQNSSPPDSPSNAALSRTQGSLQPGGDPMPSSSGSAQPSPPVSPNAPTNPAGGQLSSSNSFPGASSSTTYIIAGITLTGNPTSLVVGDTTLTPGGAPVTVFSHTLQIPSSASGKAINIDGQQTQLPPPVASSLAPSTGGAPDPNSSGNVPGSPSPPTSTSSLPAGATIVTSVSGSSTLSETFVPYTNSKYTTLSVTTTIITVNDQSSTITEIYGPGGVGWTSFNKPSGAPALPPPNVPPQQTGGPISSQPLSASQGASPGSAASATNQLPSSTGSGSPPLGSSEPVMSGLGPISKTTLSGSGYQAETYNYATLSDLIGITEPTVITRSYTETDTDDGHTTVVIGPIPVASGGVILIHPPKGDLPDISGLGGPIRPPKPGSLCSGLLKFLCGPSNSQTGPPGGSDQPPIDPATEPEGTDPEQEDKNKSQQKSDEPATKTTASPTPSGSSASASTRSRVSSMSSASSSSLSSEAPACSLLSLPPEDEPGDGWEPGTGSASMSVSGTTRQPSSTGTSPRSSGASSSTDAPACSLLTLPPENEPGDGWQPGTMSGSQGPSRTAPSSNLASTTSASLIDCMVDGAPWFSPTSGVTTANCDYTSTDTAKRITPKSTSAAPTNIPGIGGVEQCMAYQFNNVQHPDCPYAIDGWCDCEGVTVEPLKPTKSGYINCAYTMLPTIKGGCPPSPPQKLQRHPQKPAPRGRHPHRIWILKLVNNAAATWVPAIVRLPIQCVYCGSARRTRTARHAPWIAKKQVGIVPATIRPIWSRRPVRSVWATWGRATARRMISFALLMSVNMTLGV
ncbi:MAG: hypothetical protein Q9171_006278 [Xanthocarpia ochracea]